MKMNCATDPTVTLALGLLYSHLITEVDSHSNAGHQNLPIGLLTSISPLLNIWAISEMKFSIYKCFYSNKLQGLKIQNKNKQMK